MNPCRILTLAVGALCVGACVGLTSTDPALASVEDSRFEFSPDGAGVDFDVKDTSRRDVMNRLFDGTGVEIRWINSSFANERISGKFSGTPAAVARLLLAQTNLLIVHEQSGDASRVVRIIVVGPSTGDRASAGLAGIAAAMQHAGKPKEAPESTGAPARTEAPIAPIGDRRTGVDATTLMAGSAADRSDALVLSELGPSGDAAGILMPPADAARAPLPVLAAGTEAPPLIPPSQTLVALPLAPAAEGTTAPPLRGNGSAE